MLSDLQIQVREAPPVKLSDQGLLKKFRDPGAKRVLILFDSLDAACVIIGAQVWKVWDWHRVGSHQQTP